jgi:hypothetical protein
MAEYGNPDTEDWKFLEKYSPYHSKLVPDSYPIAFTWTFLTMAAHYMFQTLIQTLTTLQFW